MGDKVSVISQAAGLHITLKWHARIDEKQWTQRAANEGAVIRPVSYYEHYDFQHRDWNGAVLGYGNVSLKNIDPLMKRLSELF